MDTALAQGQTPGYILAAEPSSTFYVDLGFPAIEDARLRGSWSPIPWFQGADKARQGVAGWGPLQDGHVDSYVKL